MALQSEGKENHRFFYSQSQWKTITFCVKSRLLGPELNFERVCLAFLNFYSAKKATYLYYILVLSNVASDAYN